MKKFFKIFAIVLTIILAIVGYIASIAILFGLYYKLVPEVYIVYPPYFAFCCTYMLGLMWNVEGDFIVESLKSFYYGFKRLFK